jgi:glutathione synthase/RimK-type ligase-like ATP-grasp enzyme
MKLFFMLAYYSRNDPNPVLVEMFQHLRNGGAQVELGFAEHGGWDINHLPLDFDLYILKSRSSFWWDFAAMVHQQGKRTLNPYPSCVTVQNKLLTTQLLHTSGVTVPRTWMTGSVDFLRQLAERHPLILKPVQGMRGQGIHIVRTPDDINDLPEFTQPMLIQEFIPSTGGDIKVYAIGEQLYAVRKTFSENSFMDKGTPYPINDELRELMLKCGQALNISLYGVDVLESSEGFVVVDVNLFSGYRNYPNAARLLATHIITTALT